ncbi:MAG TPA: arginine deiminase family protein [Thermomicrobiales bacterium]|nr:arginine deiminase family protein [Thermomicrobiales bacterium]
MTKPTFDAASSTTVAPFGGHSMTASLRRVIVRRPAPPLGSEDWKAFGYAHAIDEDETQRQHLALRELLVREGIDVVTAGPDEAGHLDAIFAYDPSIMTDWGAALLRTGKELRRDETVFHALTYGELGIPILGVVVEPGMVEGGDTLWLDERSLAVGRGYRTNQSGIDQLRVMLEPIDVTVIAFDLPHWHGAGECLHLMSMISPVAADLAVVYPPLMAVALVQELGERGWRTVEVPDEEFDSMGCNVLALAPGRCLMLDGNPETRRRLEAAGCDVLTYEGSEISLNRQGGPTCLTRPIWRQN